MEHFTNEVLPLIISGYYTNLIFNEKTIASIAIAIKNNFLFLWVIARALTWVSGITKNTWDDRLAARFNDLLARMFPNRIKTVDKKSYSKHLMNEKEGGREHEKTVTEL